MKERKKKKQNLLVKVWGLTYCTIKSNFTLVISFVALVMFMSLTFYSIDKSFERYCERTALEDELQIYNQQ